MAGGEFCYKKDFLVVHISVTSQLYLWRIILSLKYLLYQVSESFNSLLSFRCYWHGLTMEHKNTAMQSQNAVSAPSTSKRILPSGLAEQNTLVKEILPKTTLRGPIHLFTILKHTTTLFSLSDHDILSREWRVIVHQVQINYNEGFSLWGIFIMVGCVLSQLKPSEFYILSFEKGLGLRPRPFSKLRI